MNACFLFYVTLLLVSLCEGVRIQLRNPIVEGEELIVTCVSDSGGSARNTLLINGQISSSTGMVNESGIHFNLGTVSRSKANDEYRCDDRNDNTNATSSPLVVLFPPGYSPNHRKVFSNITRDAVIQFILTANPPVDASNVTLTREFNGMVVNNTRISVTSENVTFSDVKCSDGGNYTLTVANSVGMGSATFEIDVIEARPVWLVDSSTTVMLFSDQFDLSDIFRACPDDNLQISCDFVGIDIEAVVNHTITTYNETMTINLNILSLNIKKIMTQASCNVTNKYGTSQSGMFSLVIIIGGAGSSMGAAWPIVLVGVFLSKILFFSST